VLVLFLQAAAGIDDRSSRLSTASDAKPVPLTVRRNPPLPGAAPAGTKGWFTTGTGFDCARKLA
jgi:hypothetical protein